MAELQQSIAQPQERAAAEVAEVAGLVDLAELTELAPSLPVAGAVESVWVL